MSEYKYGYVIIARMDLATGKRYTDSLIDVSEFMGYDLQEWVAKHRVTARLLGAESTPALTEAEYKLRCIPQLALRARYNMADGPLLIKTEEPMVWNDMDTYIGSLTNEDYAELVRSARI
jgi:hypothetical protein